MAGDITDIHGSDTDVEQSGKRMEEAVNRLDKELFTENEKILVEKVKVLERRYQENRDKAAFAKGIEKLIDELAYGDPASDKLNKQ
jgi:hypothetical protein